MKPWIDMLRTIRELDFKDRETRQSLLIWPLVAIGGGRVTAA